MRFFLITHTIVCMYYFCDSGVSPYLYTFTLSQKLSTFNSSFRTLLLYWPSCLAYSILWIVFALSYHQNRLVAMPQPTRVEIVCIFAIESTRPLHCWNSCKDGLDLESGLSPCCASNNHLLVAFFTRYTDNHTIIQCVICWGDLLIV